MHKILKAGPWEKNVEKKPLSSFEKRASTITKFDVEFHNCSNIVAIACGMTQFLLLVAGI